MAFGDRLLELLDEKDISQKEFAHILNIAPTTLNGYVRNKRQPDLELIKKIAAILEVSVDCLLEYDENGAGLSKKELSLITKIRKLDVSQQEIIYDLVNLTMKKKDNE